MQGIIRARHDSKAAALLLLAWLVMAAETPASAVVTLVEGEKGKLEADFRLMVWAVDSGPDLPLLPGLNSAPPPPQEENIQDFSVRRMRVIFRAQLGEKLEIALQAGLDNEGSKILRDDAGFRIKDAYLNYKQADALQIMAGQFKVPFLRQNLCSGFNQLLVDRSFVVAQRPAIEGQRDLGGMVWGNHGGFQYRTALFDGSDQEDVNSRSSLRGTVRLSYNWFTPEPGTSYTGTTLGQKRILQISGQVDAQNDRVDARDDAGFTTEHRDYHAWAAEFFYDQPFAERWAVTLEGARLERNDDYETAGLDTRHIDGTYGQGGLLLPFNVGPGRLQLAGRWEEIESTRGLEETSLRARTFGLTWFTTGHDRKIQFDHGEVHERPVDLDDNFYRLSFAVMF
ncbi:MAG TPA: porin [Candidatus Polarisedimenticolia bacterium]|nr:porin [Candidatus Polarisedimenticolia bacterium]